MKDHKISQIMRSRAIKDRKIQIGEDGFTLLETIAALTILALIVSFSLPRTGSGTSPNRLNALAYQVMAVLTNDRYAARLKGLPVSTVVDASNHRILSGTAERWLVIPNDVILEIISPIKCDPMLQLPNIRFFPDGYTCGSVIRLKTTQGTIAITVNRLTGSVSLAD